MATATKRKPAPKPSPYKTFADVLDRLGGVPPERVRLVPAPGTATERDLIRVNDRKEGLCELIDGILVEKAMGFEEGQLEIWLGTILTNFIRPRNLGVLTGASGPYRVAPRQVRLPDIAFIPMDRYRRRKVGEAISSLTFDLAIEVLSKSNTRREMERKLREYFAAGTLLVWFVDPRKRTVRVFTDLEHSTLLGERDTLDGGAVLPGFALALRELFAELDR
jgi:Uma2 family endonuclease